MGLARGSDSTGRVSLCEAQHAIPTRQCLTHTPTVTLPHSEIRDLLQGAQLSATALLTECNLAPASSLPGLAANLAMFYEWSRLKDADGLGHFLLSNGAVYIDHISPTICSTNRTPTTRCAARASNSDSSTCATLTTSSSSSPTTKQKQVADDFGQTEVVHKSATAQQTAVVEKIVVSPRIMERADAIFAEAILMSSSSLRRPSTASGPPGSRVLAALPLPSWPLSAHRLLESGRSFRS